MQTQTHTDASKPASFANASLTANDLARMSIEELGATYEGGQLPASLRDLDGTPRGRMLAVVGGLGRGRGRRTLARIARSRLFPWQGKSFQAKSDDEGAGVNRVHVLGDMYKFDTRIDVSAIDSKPCVLLDYDRPDNPFFIRPIRDELREVAPRLFLGPAMLDGDEPKLVLYFAIDHQR